MAPNDLLKAWIAKEGISNAEAARRVEYDRSNFHRILNGDAKPTIELAHAIDRMTGGAVPMASWVSPEREPPDLPFRAQFGGTSSPDTQKAKAA